MASFELIEEKRKHRRIPFQQDDGIYGIVVRCDNAYRQMTLSVVDVSEKGFRFSFPANMTPPLIVGEKLLLKATIGSRNLTFQSPIKLIVKWQQTEAAISKTHIGCEVCEIATESEKQLVEFIHAEIRFNGVSGRRQKVIVSNQITDPPRFKAIPSRIRTDSITIQGD